MRSTEQPRAVVFADAPWLSSTGLDAGAFGLSAAEREPERWPNQRALAA